MKTIMITDQEYKEAAILFGNLAMSSARSTYTLLENKSFNVCLALFNMLLNLERFNSNFKRRVLIRIMRPEILKEYAKIY